MKITFYGWLLFSFKTRMYGDRYRRIYYLTLFLLQIHFTESFQKFFIYTPFIDRLGELE